MNGDPVEVTAVGQDYLKAIWSATEWGQPPATVSSLAERFGTSRANASTTLKRLNAAGLVRHERYGRIELTDTGTRQAVAMVRRHRLIETFLVCSLGYGWDDVHDEAERLEHAISDTFVERIDGLLGHPVTDPHGDPIPSADGAVDYPASAVVLGAAAPGRYRVLRVSDSDPEVLRAALSAGLTPGSAVTVEPPDGTRPGPLTTVPPEAGGAIVVVPA